MGTLQHTGLYLLWTPQEATFWTSYPGCRILDSEGRRLYRSLTWTPPGLIEWRAAGRAGMGWLTSQKAQNRIFQKIKTSHLDWRIVLGQVAEVPNFRFPMRNSSCLGKACVPFSPVLWVFCHLQKCPQLVLTLLPHSPVVVKPHSLLSLRSLLGTENHFFCFAHGWLWNSLAGTSRGFLGSLQMPTTPYRKLRAREEGAFHQPALTFPWIRPCFLRRIGPLPSLSRLRSAGTAKAMRNQRGSIRHHKWQIHGSGKRKKEPWILMAMQLWEVKFPELQWGALCCSAVSFALVPFTVISCFYITFYWTIFFKL